MISESIKVIHIFILRFIGGFGALSYGVLLLYFALPHDDPWRMTHIEVRYWETPFLDVWLPFLAHPYRVPMYPFLTLILLVPCSLLYLTRMGRKFISHITSDRTSFVVFLLWMLLFAISFLPGIRVGGIFSRAVSISLLLGLIGSVVMGCGIAAMVRGTQLLTVLLDALTKLYEVMRRVIFLSRPSRFVIVLFLVFFGATNAIAYFVFEHIPHVQDSIAQVFHAKILAAGSLTAESPPHPEFFEFTHVINNGRWYSQYPPGHIALLVVPLILGIPWILNPLLGSLTVILLYWLGKELYGEGIGRLSALLALFSPFLLFMSSEFMNHATALFCFTLFLLFFARVLKSKRPVHALIAGVALGWLLMTRPFTAVAVALPFALYAVVLLVQDAKAYLKPAVSFLGSFLVLAGALLGFNDLTNGDPFLFGFQVLYGNEVMPGFGHAAWGGPHSLLRGIHQTLVNLVGLNKYLFEWPVPSLFFVFLFCGFFAMGRWDYLLLTSAFCLTGAYLFYWFQDWCFGPRFLYEAAAPLILLSARGIDAVPRLIQRRFAGERSVRTYTAGTGFIVGAMILVGGIVYLPPHFEVYGNGYWGVTRRALSAVERAGISHAVVFTQSYYGSVFLANDPWLRNDVIFVRDLGGRNKIMADLYPDRKYYRVKEGVLEELKFDERSGRAFVPALPTSKAPRERAHHLSK